MAKVTKLHRARYRVVLVDDNAWEHVAGKLPSMFGLEDINLEVISSADEFNARRDGLGRVDMYILDVMMPPGIGYSGSETHDGLITGLYVARDIRATDPLVPIILWSGSNIDTVRLLAIHMQRKLERCIFVKKPIPAPKLVELVKSYFKNGRFASPLVKRIWEGIILKPSIGGVGLDVKSLLSAR